MKDFGSAGEAGLQSVEIQEIGLDKSETLVSEGSLQEPALTRREIVDSVTEKP